MFRAVKFAVLLILLSSVLLGQTQTPVFGLSSNTDPTCKLYTKTTADLTTASGTEDEVLFNLPARGVIKGLKVKHSEAFTGTGPLTAMTVSVGDSSGDTFYTATLNIFAAVSDINDLDTPFFGSSTFAARDVFGHFIATDETMDNVTAGSVDFMVCWSILP